MIDSRTATGAGAGRRRRGAPAVAGLLVLLALVSGGLTFGLYRVLAREALVDYDALASDGVRVAGTVVRAEPASGVVPGLGPSGTVVYRFAAGTSVFEGRGGSGPPNPAPEDLAPGAAVQVVYERRDPTRSCLCDPAAQAAATRRAMVVAALGTALVVPTIGAAATVLVGRGRRRGPGRP
ncbi:DUF3592 domain-containing protein [Kineosporia sp. R_H_3]|uniref:DUF3592 domain-containing protein n=1 Tax=Kineosporia sp. R_H_3 TaxID=1961848 RepID=UPI00117A868B|nr:DUF3592 domain-containing protein [Kineosporia sp. R_H_3]